VTSKTLSLICAALWIAASGYIVLGALARSEPDILAAISIVVVSNAGMFLALARRDNPVADKSMSVLVQSSSENVILQNTDAQGNDNMPPSVPNPGHRRVS
jgi:hypothetical protein